MHKQSPELIASQITPAELPPPHEMGQLGVLPEGAQPPLEVGGPQEQLSQPGRVARAAEWASGVVKRVVEATPEVAARLRDSGVLARAERRAAGMSGKSRVAAMVGVHAIGFAANVHEAQVGYGLSGRKAAAHAGARTAGQLFKGRTHSSSR